MKAILNFFMIICSVLYLSTHPPFLLANTIPIENPNTIRGINESDYEALLAIKAQITSDPTSVLTSWNSSLHFCRWRGVICGHTHKRVVSLSLSSSKLIGTLSPFIGNLSFLHELSLSNNSFRGNIPHQISHLPRLREISLGINSFNGEISFNFSSFPHLRVLSLGDNQLMGMIPVGLASLPNIVELDLSQNNFRGHLQATGIGNMSSSLKMLSLYDNQFQGSIPNDIGRLKNLTYLSLGGGNTMSGIIPASLFNLSNLEVLYLTEIEIHGLLPEDIGIRLPKLRQLSVLNTFITGQVPTSLSNLSELQVLDLSFNSFLGSFPLVGNNLPYLKCLNIQHSFSLGGGLRDLSFLNTLTNCTNLEHLYLAGNSFTGVFPPSIFNHSSTLQLLSLGGNQMSGGIPFGLGKFKSLYYLDLVDCHFIGVIPADIGKLESLEILHLSSNNLSKEIPPSMGNLTRLSDLNMGYNNLEGSIPSSFGKLQSLQNLNLSSNKLSGVLPVELFRVSSLIQLVLGQNNFQGPLPVNISGLKSLVWLDMSQNRFSGKIPSTLGGCTFLITIKMRGNSFSGSIPESLSPLKSVEYMDLSCNSLSGQVPNFFSNWTDLHSLNLSFNNLEGRVPVDGVFANMTIISVVGNSNICGGPPGLHLPRCPPSKESKRRLSLSMIAIASIACVLIIALSIAFVFYLLRSPSKTKDASSGPEDIKPFPEVSYQMLLRATDGFSPLNLIGAGAFGFVYKGTLCQDDIEMVVAVKVMNLKNERASKSFDAECKALRNIRHRNLIKIITICSSIDAQLNDFKALVYEFMPMGSLESWLGKDQSYALSLFQRLNMAIDVASALEYLHIGCASPIIHCDLKPTNILVDDEMTAHVGDFGLAKILFSSSGIQSSSSQVRGTVGYAAPEYGLGSNVSAEGDVYSFGIILLEMITSKKPTDPMFSDGLNLHDYAKSALPDRVMEIIDQKMLGDANIKDVDIRVVECIKLLIVVGVQCSLEAPKERMSIKDAVNELKSLRDNLLYCKTLQMVVSI